jgi:hypothetical protein
MTTEILKGYKVPEADKGAGKKRGETSYLDRVYCDERGNEYKRLTNKTPLPKNPVFAIVRRNNNSRGAQWTHDIYQVPYAHAYEPPSMLMCGCCPDPNEYVRQFGNDGKRVVVYLTKKGAA